MQRLSKKPGKISRPDLFDTADIELEKAKQGPLFFLKDYRLVMRRTQIGRSYRTLKYASDFCSLITKNGPHMADPNILYLISERTLNALCEKDAADTVFLKALYILLKDEGYPIRESWWTGLNSELRSNAKMLINEPAPHTFDPAQSEKCVPLIEHLLNWMEKETDLRRP